MPVIDLLKNAYIYTDNLVKVSSKKLKKVIEDRMPAAEKLDLEAKMQAAMGANVIKPPPANWKSHLQGDDRANAWKYAAGENKNAKRGLRKMLQMW
jgi:hypothetical protein